MTRGVGGVSVDGVRGVGMVVVMAGEEGVRRE